MPARLAHCGRPRAPYQSLLRGLVCTCGIAPRVACACCFAWRRHERTVRARRSAWLREEQR